MLISVKNLNLCDPFRTGLNFTINENSFEPFVIMMVYIKYRLEIEAVHHSPRPVECYVNTMPTTRDSFIN